MKQAESKKEKIHMDVPTNVFEAFLSQLEKAEAPTDVVERLRKTILQEKDLSDRAIRAALFFEDDSNDQG